MAKDNSIAQDLADKLVTKNFDPTYTDAQGRDALPAEAVVFSFDYVAGSGKNYGTAVIVLGDENDFQFFFGDNLGKSIEDPNDKEDWFQFLEELSNFATQHRYTFSPKDITQLKHTMAGIAAIKEGLFEGYYGTRKVSYMGEVTDARLVIKHKKALEENDRRHLYVESLFIETADGERFKLPFRKLSGGRAMLEHVRQGGKPYDIRGSHIAEMVNEMAVLARFNRASQHRVFEGHTLELVESAQNYYQSLQENLKHMATNRGYQAYFESWSPADVSSESALVEDIKTLFVEQSIDARIEAALPTLAKLQQQGQAMKEAEIFESWINNLAEGTWSLPETPEQQAQLQKLMSQELVAGPDGTNATEQLYDLVGDDHLFDLISAAADADPNSNIWDNAEIVERLGELGIDTSAITRRGAEQTPEPAPTPAPQGLSEAALLDESGETFDHILDRFKHEVKQFRSGAELDDHLYEALFDYYMSTGEMPYGVAKARTGDPFNWVTQRFDQDLGGKGFRGMDEADTVNSFAEGSCNMTNEGEYCPEHGLSECGTVAGGMAPMQGSLEEGDMDEGWVKNALAAGALAGAALTGAGHAQAADLGGYNTQYLQQVVSGQLPRPMVSVDDAKAELQAREQGKTQTASSPAPSQAKKGYSQEYLQSVINGTHPRPMISVEKAQELLQQQSGVKEGQWGQAKQDPMNYNAAITGSYYEGKEDPLARIKSLALSK